MATFTIAFATIQNLLPRLYRQEFYSQYNQLMQDLEYELTAALEAALIDELNLYTEAIWGFEAAVVIDEAMQNYCLASSAAVETAWELPEVADLDALCAEFVETVVDYWHQEILTSWDQVNWFHLRVMRDLQLLSGQGPFLRLQEIVYDFAMSNNLRIILWEIEPLTAHLGEILLEIDGRQTGVDPMISLGNEEIAIRQQNYYHQDTGGFAIALSGTFQPAYRVLSIISTLFVQILIVIFFVALLVAGWFSRYLANPIIQLSASSKQLRKLEFNERVKINRRDEIGDLSSNLDFMSRELKNALDNLQYANDKLKIEMEREREQERQRRNLFTSISHELKTPITILKGEIGGMIDQVGAYQDRDVYLKSAYNWTQTLERLVLEILTITKLEGEQMHLNVTQVNISNLITEVCLTQQVLAASQNVLISQHLDLNLAVLADESQFRIALANIINNAIFYTPPHEIVMINLTQHEKTATLLITNTGVQIDKSELKQLFEPFYRIDKSRNRHTGGSGLGLFIVKNILDLHQFDYAIANVADGVCFTIKMPRVI